MQNVNFIKQGVFQMKKLLTAITLGASIVALSACSLGDEVLVKTSNGNITQEDLYKELVDSNGPAMLERMIQEKVLRDKYSVSDKEINEELDKVKSQFSSDEEFENALASSGIADVEIFKEQIELSLLQTKAITDGVKVDDKKLKKYFEENKETFVTAKASHILVQDEETAKEIKKQLDEGADFAKLAKEKSIDTATAQNGGELGEFQKGDMVAEFSEVAFSIELNKISDVVKSDYGYHIIKVTERTQKTLEKNKEEIKESYLLANSKPIVDVIEDLKKKQKVEIKDKDLKTKIEELLSSSQVQVQQ